MKNKILLLLSVSLLALNACNDSTKDKAVDNSEQQSLKLGKICTIEYIDIADSCKDGEPIFFKPTKFGSEQFPLIFIAHFCDLNKNIQFNNSGVICSKSAQRELIQPDGVFTDTKDGRVFKEYSIKDGKLNGPYTEYNQEGQKIIESNYVNDLEEGTVKYYNNQGVVIKEYTAKAGDIHGEFTFYHDNGQLFQKGKIIDGEGQVTEFDNSGKEVQKFIIENNMIKETTTSPASVPKPESTPASIE